MNRKLSPNQLLLILTGLNLFNYLDRYVINAVRTPLADEFGLGYGDSGRAVTAFMLGYFITSPIFGYLGDRVGRKGLIAAGIFVWSIGTILTGWAWDFGVLMGFRALVGVGEASYATLGPGLIADAWPPGRRNNALTIFYLAIPVGSAAGYFLGGEMASAWGWREAFVWAGAPGLVLALLLLPFREQERGESEPERKERLVKPRLRDMLGLFRIANYQLVLWGYVAYTFALGAFAFWGPTFMEKAHGLSTAEADRFFGAVIIGAGVVGTLVGGLAATWWHKRNPAAYAWVLTVSMFLAVPTSFVGMVTSSTALSMGMFALSNLFLFLSTGPVNTLILETVPVNLRASAMAISILMIHLFGDMWSPQIVGNLADRLHGNIQGAVLILPGVLAIAGLFSLALALNTVRMLRKARASSVAVR